MKPTLKTSILKYSALGAGGLGLLMRLALYETGFDGRGLLVTGHWANIGICVLTAIVIPVLFILCRTLSGSTSYRAAYPASPVSALGAALAGFAILFTGIREFSLLTRIDLIASLLAVAAGVSLLVLTVFRFLGKKPTPLLHALVCLFFAIRMVQRYRFWSADPQLQDYCFCLGSYVALMLASYQHAAFDAGMGNHKHLWFYSLTATFLCCLSVKGVADTWLLLCFGIWAFTNLTRQVPQRRRKPIAQAGSDIQP